MNAMLKELEGHTYYCNACFNSRANLLNLRKNSFTALPLFILRSCLN